MKRTLHILSFVSLIAISLVFGVSYDRIGGAEKTASAATYCDYNAQCSGTNCDVNAFYHFPFDQGSSNYNDVIQGLSTSDTGDFWTDRFGNPNSAFGSTSSEAYNLSYPGFQLGNLWSTSFWFKIDFNPSVGNCFIDGGPTYWTWRLGTNSSGYCEYQHWSNATGGYKTITSSIYCGDGNWHHYASVANQNNGTIYLYIDGQLQGSFNDSGNTGSWASAAVGDPTFFVCDTNGLGYKLGDTLAIDDFKYFPFPLTGAQVSNLYNSGGAGTCQESCSDGVQNQGETGIDCGGPCSPCANGLGCSIDADCQSGLCGGVAYSNYWRMENNFQDEAGLVNGSGTSTSFEAGLDGQAVRFNSNGFVSFGDRDEFDSTGDRSISLWFRKNGSGAQVLASKLAAIGGGNGWALSTQGSGKIQFLNQFAGGSNGIHDSVQTISDSNWHHVVATWSIATAPHQSKIYIDGVLDSTQARSTNNLPNDIPFYLGAYEWTPGSQTSYFQNGNLDEVAFFQRVLTDAEVAKLYQAGQGGLELGVCAATATCSDGIQNQGETGIDCGGPCSACAPVGCPVNGENGTFFTSANSYRIRKVDAVTGIINTVAGNGGLTGYPAQENVPATSTEIGSLRGFAIDQDGNIFFGPGRSQIRRVDANTGMITNVAGNYTQGYSGDGGPATNAGIGLPNDVAVDHLGNLYFNDLVNHRIRKVVLSTGIISTVAGTGSNADSGDGGPATSAAIKGDGSLAVDSQGDVYLTGFHRIRKIDVSTGIITTVAGTGSQGFSGDGGPATSATLRFPTEVAIDENDNLYIVDNSNHRIRKVDASTGIITTVAGSGSASGSAGDGGLATNASFTSSGLYGVSVDSLGNIYLVDGHRVRKVDASTGIITTVAGDGTFGYSGDGGLATSAQLQSPLSIVTISCPAAAESCSDGIKNQDETDVDCGGVCDDCANGMSCALDSDCVSGSCAGKQALIYWNEFAGSLQNGATEVTGLSGRAYQLDGVNDYVDLGQQPGMRYSSSTEGSISFWIKLPPQDVSDYPGILYHWTPNAEGYKFNVSAQDNNGIYYGIGNGLGAGTGYTTLGSGISVIDDQWHHIVGTYSDIDNEIKLYQDGSLVGSASWSNFGSSNSNVFLGRDACCGGGRYLEGIIDEVYFTDRVLEDWEIAAMHASNGKSRVCANSSPTETCFDGIENQDESDIDCGGSICPKCDTGNSCNGAADCLSGLCDGGVCGSSPTCEDGVMNGDETDIDCGGTGCARCNEGQGCTSDASCTPGLVCKLGVCEIPSQSFEADTETEVDFTPGETVPFAPIPNGSGFSFVYKYEDGPYTARVESEDAFGNSFEGNWDFSINNPPSPIHSLVIDPPQENGGSVDVSGTFSSPITPNGYVGTLIIRSDSSLVNEMPTDGVSAGSELFGGVLVDSGALNSFTDSFATPNDGTRYYYTFWAYDDTGKFSLPVVQPVDYFETSVTGPTVPLMQECLVSYPNNSINPYAPDALEAGMVVRVDCEIPRNFLPQADGEVFGVNQIKIAFPEPNAMMVGSRNIFYPDGDDYRVLGSIDADSSGDEEIELTSANGGLVDGKLFTFYLNGNFDGMIQNSSTPKDKLLSTFTAGRMMFDVKFTEVGFTAPMVGVGDDRRAATDTESYLSAHFGGPIVLDIRPSEIKIGKHKERECPGSRFDLLPGGTSSTIGDAELPDNVVDDCEIAVEYTQPPQPPVPQAGEDADGDGIPNELDNCPAEANPMQQDIDGDTVGDACDADIDGDGTLDSSSQGWGAGGYDPSNYRPNGCVENNGGVEICDDFRDNDCDGQLDTNDTDCGGSGIGGKDNCPFVNNPDQADSDGDGVGDACEGDYDGDGAPDPTNGGPATDNCPFLINASQNDRDGDGLGDVCDPPVCGNGVYEPASGLPWEGQEQCEGSDYGGLSCGSFGYDRGSLSCGSCQISTANCCQTQCNSVCGGGDDGCGGTCPTNTGASCNDSDWFTSGDSCTASTGNDANDCNGSMASSNNLWSWYQAVSGCFYYDYNACNWSYQGTAGDNVVYNVSHGYGNFLEETYIAVRNNKMITLDWWCIGQGGSQGQILLDGSHLSWNNVYENPYWKHRTSISLQKDRWYKLSIVCGGVAGQSKHRTGGNIMRFNSLSGQVDFMHNTTQ